MERTHLLVIAGAFVVVAFVGFQLFAGSGELDEAMPLARARSAGERADGVDGSGNDAGEGRYGAGSRAGGGESGRSRSSGTGLGSGRNEGTRRESGKGSSR